MRLELEPRRSTVSTKTIIAAAVVAAFVAPAPISATALTGRLHATSGAFAATKPLRTARPAQRSGGAQTPAQQVLGLDGRVVGTDPDAGVRFQLRRDGGMERGTGGSSGGGSGGGGGGGM
jgi:hypothetical protein